MSTDLALEIRVGVLFNLKWSREERASRKRELGTHVDRGGRRRLVTALLSHALVEVTTTAQPAERAITDARSLLGDVVLGRRRRLVYAYTLDRLLEHGVDAERVEVKLRGSLVRAVHMQKQRVTFPPAPEAAGPERRRTTAGVAGGAPVASVLAVSSIECVGSIRCHPPLDPARLCEALTLRACRLRHEW